jgi:hypothetical protein
MVADATCSADYHAHAGPSGTYAPRMMVCAGR